MALLRTTHSCPIYVSQYSGNFIKMTHSIHIFIEFFHLQRKLESFGYFFFVILCTWDH